jgi:prephenate dehydrogenase
MAGMPRVTIIGLGLIGGSLGLSLRRARAARVTGYSRRRATLREAKRRGAIDAGTTDLRAAVRGADVVVLAAPVDAIVPLARRAARLVRPGTVLTDVGSTKAGIVRALEHLPRGVAFVGGHPLAGSERRGIGAMQPDLFRGSVCVLMTGAPAAAARRVAGLWRRVGARIVRLAPEAHDRLLGGASHLPHLVAFALARACGAGPLPPPRSLLDMTRIALSDADLWDDILLGNRAGLGPAVRAFDREWRRAVRLVRAKRPAALRAYLAQARRRAARLHG